MAKTKGSLFLPLLSMAVRLKAARNNRNTNKINVFLQSLCQSLRENRVLEADGLVSVYLNPAVASVNTAG